ncbi:MAG: hypothetical protein JWP44_4868, partial [Mucilaginibacter sp.]|nr:hypothetical protein [Mucilaginibacter sp.]
MPTSHEPFEGRSAITSPPAPSRVGRLRVHSFRGHEAACGIVAAVEAQ